jgi:hypothetical protein
MSCAICWEDEKPGCKRADHIEATRKRAARRGRPWSSLVVHTEAGGRRITPTVEMVYGDRQYLDSNPIHCGTVLLLQNTSCLSDDFGEFTSYLDIGTPVRYEVEHVSRKIGTVRIPVMYVGVGGHSFSANIEQGHYFRWPERS